MHKKATKIPEKEKVLDFNPRHLSPLRDVFTSFEDFMLDMAHRNGEFMSHSPVTSRSYNNSTAGLNFFQLVEEQVGMFFSQHGGVPISNGQLPHNLGQIHQNYHMFELSDTNVIVGYCTSADLQELPRENKTRRNSAQCNAQFVLGLDLQDQPNQSECFTIHLIVSRARKDYGEIAGINLAVIAPKYDEFIYNRPLEIALAEMNPATTRSEPSSNPLKLKGKILPFSDKDDADKSAEIE